MNFKKILKRALWVLAVVFVLTNIVANFHAYKFTHYADASAGKINVKTFTTTDKIRASVFGLSGPRPVNLRLPDRPFETIRLKSNRDIECWLMRTDSAKGTAIICHGYGASKASMLDKAYIIMKAGYNIMLVDFMGSGGSEGNKTTIGYEEALQVKTVYDHLRKNGERRFVLLGSSMGAVAIMKAQHDYHLQGTALVLECPFGSLRKAVQARFRIIGAPEFPMAGLMIFWGGVQNGFNGFKFCPEAYARQITCPTLLMYGEKDDRVSREEIDMIYQNLAGAKRLHTFPLSGHESYLELYREEWTRELISFIQ